MTDELEDGISGEEFEPPTDVAVVEAKAALLEFFKQRSNETFYERQLEVLFENRGVVNATPLEERTPGYQPRGIELKDGFYHWITSKALKELVAEGRIKVEKRVLGIADEETHQAMSISFFRYRTHRYGKRQADEIADLVGRFSQLGRAMGRHAEMMFDAALAGIGFVKEGEDVREYGGRSWTKTGHDLDRVYVRDGVAYGAELKNTLKYIGRDELRLKLAMCAELRLKPLFICRMLPREYIWTDIIQNGGYALVFGEQLYPFGQEALIEEVRARLELPVDSPRAVPEGLLKRFLTWHHKNR